MNRALFLGSIALAFIAGTAASRLLPQAAIAADTMMTAQIIHVPDLKGDALGPASGTGFRSKTFVMADGMTLSVQAGNVPKHLHPDANEMQYILEGTGTIWLGEKEVHIKPGDLVVIPKGTAHGGTKPDAGSAPIKAIALKTPPQAAEGGTKMLP
ncbi:MAG TPA: cupin domain-containing protein [Xanthobacteraceae bacterium]|nr:cupin domain-containing protein [Xanthobacteraceae bacterium]